MGRPRVYPRYPDSYQPGPESPPVSQPHTAYNSATNLYEIPPVAESTAPTPGVPAAPYLTQYSYRPTYGGQQVSSGITGNPAPVLNAGQVAQPPSILSRSQSGSSATLSGVSQLSSRRGSSSSVYFSPGNLEAGFGEEDGGTLRHPSILQRFRSSFGNLTAKAADMLLGINPESEEMGNEISPQHSAGYLPPPLPSGRTLAPAAMTFPVPTPTVQQQRPCNSSMC